MPDCRFQEYFLPDTPETTFGDETLAGPNLSGEHSLAESRLTLWRA